MNTKLAVVFSTFLNAIVFLIFLAAVSSNFYFNTLILGVVGCVVFFFVLAWVLGVLDDMFLNWEKDRNSRV